MAATIIGFMQGRYQRLASATWVWAGLSLALQGQNITDEKTLITGQADARLVERYQRSRPSPP